MPGVTFGVQLDLAKMDKWLKEHTKGVMEGIGQAVAGCAEDAMLLSKAVYVPVVSGNLRSTGEVSDLQVSEGLIEIELSYGGPAAPYAAIVHEAPPDRGQGKSQYLAKPFYLVGRTMEKRIRDHLASLYD